MSLVLLPFLAFLAAAASPATDEADRLLEAGDDRGAFEAVDAAAGQDDLDAISYLAWFYESGRHVPQDPARAAFLYARAAEAGHAHSQWRFGVMLDLGEGVAENPDEALRWIRRAAEQGNAGAWSSLGVMYALGRGTERDYAASMAAYRRAAELGESTGFYGVGVLHSNGEGVPPDPVEAAAWFLVALTMEDERAEPALRNLDLAAAQMRAAVARANAILEQHGREARIDFEEASEARPIV